MDKDQRIHDLTMYLLQQIYGSRTQDAETIVKDYSELYKQVSLELSRQHFTPEE